jgi:hypothetical protein
MLPLRRVLCRALSWMAVAGGVSLATPALAAAGQTVVADFDGDGKRDVAVLHGHRTGLVQVWLSSTHTSRVLRAKRPLLHVAAVDLDGDGRAELIASDNGAHLVVWRLQDSTRFRRVRAKAPARPARPPAAHGFDTDHTTRENLDLSGQDDGELRLTSFVVAPRAPVRAIRPYHFEEDAGAIALSSAPRSPPQIA